MRHGALIRLLAVLCMALPVSAGETLQALRSRGDLLGWEAIGRVDLQGQGYCTGALIAQDLVLTAAHCVFDQEGMAIPPEKVRFRSGYVDGDQLSLRNVNRIVVEKGYVPTKSGLIRNEMMRHDVALLRLSSPIFSSEADPFAIYDEPKVGEKVSVLSYGRGRSEHLSWQRDCSILERRSGLMSFDCNVTFGSSGAPVFVRYGTRVRILSLVSAMGRDAEGRKMAFGMELPETVTELKRRMRTGDAPPARVSSGMKRITVGTRMSGNGAKFVRVD